MPPAPTECICGGLYRQLCCHVRRIILKDSYESGDGHTLSLQFVQAHPYLCQGNKYVRQRESIFYSRAADVRVFSARLTRRKSPSGRVPTSRPAHVSYHSDASDYEIRNFSSLQVDFHLDRVMMTFDFVTRLKRVRGHLAPEISIRLYSLRSFDTQVELQHLARFSRRNLTRWNHRVRFSRTAFRSSLRTIARAEVWMACHGP